MTKPAIIPHARNSGQSWRASLRAAVRDPQALYVAAEIPLADGATAAHEQFPTLAPRRFVERMRPTDADDPLWRQIAPTAEELQPVAGFTSDPVGDGAAYRDGGVIHKYQGRALVIATGACAINCRYCFRRHFPYAQRNAGRDHWRQALAYFADHADLHEMILSGGDPLLLGTDRLRDLTDELAALLHVRTLRIHTRVPIALPERITTHFADWLGALSLRRVIVLHVNHPRELDDDVARAISTLRDCGARLFNQSVLLRGVNDDAAVLAQLSEALFSLGVQPYYLHQLDRTAGAAHFEVPAREATRIMHALRSQLPGYLAPALVREEAGAPYKIPVL